MSTAEKYISTSDLHCVLLNSRPILTTPYVLRAKRCLPHHFSFESFPDFDNCAHLLSLQCCPRDQIMVRRRQTQIR